MKEELFKSGRYKEFDLDKPHVLSAIDYINQEMGYDLSYNNYDLEDLLKSLKEVA